jgi:ribonuclease HII
MGYALIAGVDEAGRGSLAGPVVAAAVILPQGCRLPGLDDSKRVPAERRTRLADRICDRAIAVAVGVVGVRTVDLLNIHHGACEAMRRAVGALSVFPDIVLVDGRPVRGFAVPQRAIVHGDALCGSIAAASIIAKVARDRLMDHLDDEFPGYGFRSHRGYATPEHFRKLAQLGACAAHRRSFSPVIRSLQGSLGLHVD